MNHLLGEIKPSFGAFVRRDNANHYVDAADSNQAFLQFDLKESRKGKIWILKLKAKNISDKPFNINSLLVSEFLLPNFFPEQILENGWQNTSFCGYRGKIDPSKKKIILAHDQNQFSLRRDFGYLHKSLVNEWFTQIVGRSTSLVIGALSIRKQFTQVYLRQEKHGLRIRINCQLDGLSLSPGESIFSEKIALIFGSKKESLKKFAHLLRRYNSIERLKKAPRGLCCAYYQQGLKVDQEYILKQLKVVKEIFPRKSLSYIQIDAGYCLWGDWLEVKRKFPSGMKYIVDKIKQHYLKAGIWFAPFLVDPRSRLYREHQDWLLRNDCGDEIRVYTGSLVNLLPGLALRVLDPTLSFVQQYLRKVVLTFKSWGFELLKIDYTYAVCLTNRYYKPITRAEALRTGLEIIRQAAGDKIHLMSAISPLSPLLGIIDSARMGVDSIVPQLCKIPVLKKIINEFMLSENLRNSKARDFLNGKVFRNDADCLVLRNGVGLSKRLVRAHYEFAKKYKGSIWIGDSLVNCSQDVVKQYRELFSQR